MKNILCYGDSNTWGYDYTQYIPEIEAAKRLPFDERWPGILQNNLGDEYRIIEDALNARTCMYEDPYDQYRNGFKSLQVALDANAPLDMIIIQMGCNELKDYFRLSAEMIACDIEMLVKAAKTSYYHYPAPKILLIAPAPVDKDIENMIFGYCFGPEAYNKSVKLGALCKKIAENHGCGFVDCAELDFKLNKLDGLHYCREDHQKLGDAVTKEVIKMFS